MTDDARERLVDTIKEVLAAGEGGREFTLTPYDERVLREYLAIHDPDPEPEGEPEHEWDCLCIQTNDPDDCDCYEPCPAAPATSESGEERKKDDIGEYIQKSTLFSGPEHL